MDKNKNEYTSFQPSFETNFLRFSRKYPTVSILRRYVDYFYELETKTTHDMSLPVMPDGCMDFFFAVSDEGIKPFTAGTADQFVGLNAFKGHYIFSVRFKPGGFKPFADIAMPCILSVQCQETFFTQRIDELSDAIMAASNFRERIDIMEQFLLKNLVEKDQYNIVEYGIRRMKQTSGKIEIKELAEETIYSARYLRRLFDEYIGLSPKKIAEIIQIQNAVFYLQSTDMSSAEIASLTGFADQSHMNRALKSYFSAPSAHLKDPEFFIADRHTLNNIYFF